MGMETRLDQVWVSIWNFALCDRMFEYSNLAYFIYDMNQKVQASLYQCIQHLNSISYPAFYLFFQFTAMYKIQEHPRCGISEKNHPSNCQRKLTGCRLIKLVSWEKYQYWFDGDTFFTPKPPQYFNKRVSVTRKHRGQR